MKNLKQLFIGFVAMLTAVSCGDPELPVELQPEMQYGAYARKMSQTGKFDFFAIPTSQIDIHVEYYDENGGKNISTYDIEVEYIDITGGGANSIGKKPFRTINSSEFVVNSDGYLSSDISLGFEDALTALGVTSADITGGNTVRFWFTITKTDGTKYDYNNTGPNLMSSNAFGALFRLNVGIVCPSDWTLGSLSGTNSNDGTLGTLGAGETTASVELTRKSGKDNQYQLSDWTLGYRTLKYTGTYYTTGPVFIDNCNVVSITGVGDYGYGFSMLPGTASVSADRTAFTYSWESDLGEGGVATLTYDDGSLWPELYN